MCMQVLLSLNVCMYVTSTLNIEWRLLNAYNNNPLTTYMYLGIHMQLHFSRTSFKEGEIALDINILQSLHTPWVLHVWINWPTTPEAVIKVELKSVGSRALWVRFTLLQLLVFFGTIFGLKFILGRKHKWKTLVAPISKMVRNYKNTNCSSVGYVCDSWIYCWREVLEWGCIDYWVSAPVSKPPVAHNVYVFQ